MEIIFDEEAEISEAIAEKMNRAACICVSSQGVDPDVCEISFSLVSPDEIRSLNAQYRNKDAVTDVLSFPQYDDFGWLTAAPHTHTNTGEDADEDADTDAHTNTGEDADEDSDTDADTNTGEDADEDADTDADTNTGEDADFDTDTDTHTGTDAEAMPEICLGDVVICEDTARRQAEEYGHSYEREMVYLFVHSVLHLLGYDHMTDEDKQEMRKAEESVMEEIGLAR